MITVDQLLAFGVAALVLIAIPGPSVVFVIGRALAYGRAVALVTVLGNSLGLLVIVLLVTAGLSVLLERSILAFTVVKLAGAAYLVWLGVQAVRHRKQLSMTDVDGTATRAPLSLPTALRQGFVVGLTNPKAFMIFAAVLPQFVDRGAGHVPVQMLPSALRGWFARSPRRGEAVGALGGASMVGLGVALAVTGHRK